VHNVPKDKTLPPLLLLTADRMSVVFNSIQRSLIVCADDDRVVPLHSYKLIAALQNTLPHNPNPLLIRIDKKAGHGAGKSTEQKYVQVCFRACNRVSMIVFRIKEAADKFGFAAHVMGLKWYGN
jgi:prolyl oligopeptidase